MLNMQIKKFTFFRRLAVFIFRNGISMQKNNILRRLYDTKQALCKARNWYLLRFFLCFSCLPASTSRVSQAAANTCILRLRDFWEKITKLKQRQFPWRSIFAFVDLRIFARVLSSAIKISPQDDDEGLKINRQQTFESHLFGMPFICDLWLSAIRMIMKIEMTNK